MLQQCTNSVARAKISLTPLVIPIVGSAYASQFILFAGSAYWPYSHSSQRSHNQCWLTLAWLLSTWLPRLKVTNFCKAVIFELQSLSVQRWQSQYVFFQCNHCKCLWGRLSNNSREPVTARPGHEICADPGGFQLKCSLFVPWWRSAEPRAVKGHIDCTNEIDCWFTHRQQARVFEREAEELS